MWIVSPSITRAFPYIIFLLYALKLVKRKKIVRNKNLKINHINNRSNSEATSKLIKYDSVHGKLNAELDFDPNHLIINKNKITFSQETKIEDINWKKHDVDYVFECTGKFNSKEKLLAHIENGAKKVIVSAPCKNADKTIVFGINENIITKEDKIISAASCTTIRPIRPIPLIPILIVILFI